MANHKQGSPHADLIPFVQLSRTDGPRIVYERAVAGSDVPDEPPAIVNSDLGVAS